MKIAIDNSSLGSSQNKSAHNVRGIGFYTKNLIDSLIQYFPENNYQIIDSVKEVDKDVDLIHLTYFDPFFLTYPLFSKIPIVITVHDLTPLVFPQNFPVGIRGKVKWSIQKRLLLSSRRVICDSECSKKDIIKFTKYKSSKIDVVYLAASHEYKKIDDNNRLQTIVKKYSLPKSFLLYVGDATYNKNLPNILASAEKSGIKTFVVGKSLSTEISNKHNPWNKDLLFAQNFIRSSKNIEILGFVSNDDLACLYNLADALLMPSLYEGFGLPIIEAMSCGCPVITSNISSLPEIAGEAAVYVDPYNIEEILSGIRRIVDDREYRKEIIRRGFKNIEKFNWKLTASETINVYNKAINDK